MIKAGDKLPLFELRDQDGNWVRSVDLIGDRNLVIYFYPRDFTPGCTAESCAFRDGMAEFESLNARVVGVSSDTPAIHLKFAKAHHLPFTLLSDEKNEVRKAFGVKGALLGLVPGRSTFVVDKSGVVRFRTDHLGRASDHVTEAKAALDQIKR